MITNEILEMEETKKFLKWVFATKETQINRWLCQYQRLQDLKQQLTNSEVLNEKE